VIDLTNTSRYYSPSEWTKQGTKHVKVREQGLSLDSNMYTLALIGFVLMTFFSFQIACRGRDAVPENEAVNTFVYEVT
jgi:mRNA-capping enzyme